MSNAVSKFARRHSFGLGAKRLQGLGALFFFPYLWRKNIVPNRAVVWLSLNPEFLITERARLRAPNGEVDPSLRSRTGMLDGVVPFVYKPKQGLQIVKLHCKFASLYFFRLLVGLQMQRSPRNTVASYTCKLSITSITICNCNEQLAPCVLGQGRARSSPHI